MVFFYDFKTIHDEANLWSHTKRLIQEAFEWETALVFEGKTISESKEQQQQ